MVNPVIGAVENAVEAVAGEAGNALLTELYTQFTTGLNGVTGHSPLLTAAMKIFDTGFELYQAGVLTPSPVSPPVASSLSVAPVLPTGVSGPFQETS